MELTLGLKCFGQGGGGAEPLPLEEKEGKKTFAEISSTPSTRGVRGK